MDRIFFALGAASALVGVAAGAFGAHVLRGRLTPEMLDVFETAVRYQLFHALARHRDGGGRMAICGGDDPILG